MLCKGTAGTRCGAVESTIVQNVVSPLSKVYLSAGLFVASRMNVVDGRAGSAHFSQKTPDEEKVAGERDQL